MCLPSFDDYKKLENELVLVRAQAGGAASLLLDVQRDCIDRNKIIGNLQNALNNTSAKVIALELELSGVQVAYGELSQKYDQLKQEYEACFDYDWDDYTGYVHVSID